jgi:hypothetical protein
MWDVDWKKFYGIGYVFGVQILIAAPLALSQPAPYAQSSSPPPTGYTTLVISPLSYYTI